MNSINLGALRASSSVIKVLQMETWGLLSLHSCVSQSFIVGYIYIQFLVASTAGSFWGDSSYSFPPMSCLMDQGAPFLLSSPSSYHSESQINTPGKGWRPGWQLSSHAPSPPRAPSQRTQLTGLGKKNPQRWCGGRGSEFRISAQY